MKDAISSAKMPQLSQEENKEFEKVEHKTALEAGLRTKLSMKDGSELSIMQLNKGGQELLGKTLPPVYAKMGMDVVKNCEFIIDY